MSSVKAHRGYRGLDRGFALDDLTDWREKLAKAVYKARPDWAGGRPQQCRGKAFMDRLIFIRIAEDRGILPRRELEDIAGAWK